VTDGVGSAIEQAKAAAGDRVVQVVGGVDVIEQLQRADLVDELHIDVVPVLLGAGRRFFDDAAWDRVELEKLRVQEVGRRTSFVFRVLRTRGPRESGVELSG
jgi:dihydrofolate reductase